MYLSPSKYKTVSTICSNSLGPAKDPSFVTCPTINVDIPIFLEIFINLEVPSFIWLTVPGADDISGLYTVCIESTIIKSGFTLSKYASIILKLFSENINRLSVFTPNLCALIFIWDWDSSPDIYSTFLPAHATFLETCIKSVDFPIPGSPPTRTKDPFTIPPPKTLSNSSISVENLSSCFISIEFILIGFESDLLITKTSFGDFFSSISSTNVFHFVHSGHFPNHLLVSYPQDWHTYFVLIFAIFIHP